MDKIEIANYIIENEKIPLKYSNLNENFGIKPPNRILSIVPIVSPTRVPMTKDQ